MRDETTRTLILERLRRDLIGPTSDEEVIRDAPSDRYLTGILFPTRSPVGADADDGADPANADSETTGADDTVPMSSVVRPSSAGLSFALRPGALGEAGFVIRFRAGRYHQGEHESWRRLVVDVSVPVPMPEEGLTEIPAAEHGVQDLRLHVRRKTVENLSLFTVIASNGAPVGGRQSFERNEESAFFQCALEVTPSQGAQFAPKPKSVGTAEPDDDQRVAELIYRDVEEYAVGHTCSASWETDGAGQVTCVRTEWMPTARIEKPRETGDPVFDALSAEPDSSPLNARWLSEAPADALTAALGRLCDTYGSWIRNESERISHLPEAARGQAEAHVEVAGKALERMKSGVELLGRSPDARTAFQLANRAMWIQDGWKKARSGKHDAPLLWRPFQLGFVLLCLSSSSDDDDPHRETMDLLWFPTGGGKTEAYLLLTAYVIFLRRLNAAGDPSGAGVTVFMRYTLRLLTVQQFQRAAAMILACELLRRGGAPTGAAVLPDRFDGDEPVSIGLWVGEDSVPNRVADAIKALNLEAASSPRQISSCPCCNAELVCAPSEKSDSIHFRCVASGCQLSASVDPLPIWTVDEDIYRKLPTLMIGTADKYAQLPRKAETGRLFGAGVNVDPPILIIQDELHLISGPLGTMSGLYEIAVDELCAKGGRRPKIIGSTATIRRAGDQIRALYNRDAFQFPPPGLDHRNSGFASTDAEDPGRLYVGVTTAGRSAKFALQAVSASLLQAASDAAIPESQKDAYWTLVSYFNSLRELGGALALMRDDVGRSAEEYASRRSETARRLAAPIELTSRVSSSEIPDLLEQLELKQGDEDAVDSVLASNMISVGVDVTRLGLMLVQGQPKTIAEYIQATSRVGRGSVPGLVVTLYNANKSRDRSRYETFESWHRSLYRDVEPTSVTPFAPRARDRAIHAPLVAMARHLIPALSESPADILDVDEQVDELVNRIVARARDVDADEEEGVRDALEEFLTMWRSRSGEMKKYWDDWTLKGLLLSAETAEERKASLKREVSGRPTPNSLRSVEPSTTFVLVPAPKL